MMCSCWLSPDDHKGLAGLLVVDGDQTFCLPADMKEWAFRGLVKGLNIPPWSIDSVECLTGVFVGVSGV